MNTYVASVALAAALASPFSAAQAVGTQTYNVCGGRYASWTGFAFCASVQVTVVAKSQNVWNVAMQIANLSGTNGSFAGSLFAQIGLDNLGLEFAKPTNIVVTQGGSTECSNSANSEQGNAHCWSVTRNKPAAAGINVDLLAGTSNGVNLSIASRCAGASNYIYTCGSGAPVTISFDVNKNFDPSQVGEVYIKAQGELGSTECETGSRAPAERRCSAAPVTATPEPATLTLVGSGVAAILAQARRRRKKGDVSEPAVD